MDADQALSCARRMVREHGLHDWRVRLDHARQRCGACHFRNREITLSRHFVALNEEAELHATVLHEIAHALAGPRAGHGPRWRQVAAEIGARVDTTNESAVMPMPGWALQCLNCLQVVARRHRRSLDLERVRCRTCGEQHGVLQWVRNVARPDS